MASSGMYSQEREGDTQRTRRREADVPVIDVSRTTVTWTDKGRDRGGGVMQVQNDQTRLDSTAEPWGTRVFHRISGTLKPPLGVSCLDGSRSRDDYVLLRLPECLNPCALRASV